jgi:beta-galactosidase
MITSLVKNWRFALGSNEGAETPDFDDSAWKTLDLPHDWQIENNRDPDIEGGASQGFYPRNQIGWYRYHFKAPAEWKDRWVQIRFDGVQRFSTVWLNGVKLGGRPYGYVPFDLDLNTALNYEKENVLAVKVDNTIGSGDRWYSGAGIYRQVQLSVSDRVFIPRDGVRVTTLRLDDESALVRVAVEVINKTAAPVQAEIKGLITVPPAGSFVPLIIPVHCAAGSTSVAEIDVEIKNPRRWDPDSPALYGLSLGLGPDTTSLRFGLREVRFDGEEGFFLNGKNIKLKGVDLHHDGGAVGAAVPEALWRRRFKKLKDCGANAIRCSHNPQAAEFYDLADEMGFLLIDELYDKWTPTDLYYKEFFDAWWERDLEAMIRRDRNHPSVILWSVGNEIEFQFQEHFYEQLKLMCDKTRSLDSGRPVSAALMPPCFKDYDDHAPLEKKINAVLRYAGIVDVLMLNYMESFYAELKHAGLNKAVIGSEVFTYYRSTEEQFIDMPARSPWQDVVKNKFVAGSFLWAGIDYLGESSGWLSRGWSGSLLDTAGFEKIRSWYISSHWKEEPVLKLAVFDENEPFDMAGSYWSFPQMRRHWNYPVSSPVKHVAAITNCDLVKLYLNNETVRVAAPDHERDSIAHIWVPFRPGTLRAEGWRNGVKVAEDALYTAKRPATVEIIAPVRAAPEEVVPVEIWLKDKYGEPWVLDNPLTRVKLQGNAELIALDNGDMCSAEVYAASKRSFWNGHILALLRIGNSAAAAGTAAGMKAATVRLTAEVEGMNPVSHDIAII